MSKLNVSGDQALEKHECSGSVSQNVEHLKIDPLSEVINSVKKILVSRNIERKARGRILFFHDRSQIAVLKVVPEKSPVEHAVKKRKLRYRVVERALQRGLIYLFLKFACYPKYSCVGSSCGRRNYLGRIVELIPVGTSIHKSFITLISYFKDAQAAPLLSPCRRGSPCKGHPPK